MGIGLLGQKVGCTQLYTKSGDVIPVTVLQLGPCHVLQLRTKEKDGYAAVQLGFKDKARSRAKKCERGQVASIDSKRKKAKQAAGEMLIEKANCEPKCFVREFKVETGEFSVGQELNVSVFDPVVAVDITAISKGSGYSGVMKRHNYSGQRASHGVKKCHRHLGSTGCSAFPSRTPKGKKMAGQYGATQVTVRNQKVVMIDTENNLLVIRGAVPGPRGGFIKVSPTNLLPTPKSNPWRLVREDVQTVESASE